MNERGFTTLELIVTLLIIGIISATVVPRFYKSQDFEYLGYQKELILKLRTIQLRAMQQAHSETCKEVVLQSSQIFLKNTVNNPPLPICGNTSSGDTTRIAVEGNHSITFSNNLNASCLEFNSLGQPTDCLGNVQAIELLVQGTETVSVSVNTEGFINGN